MSIVDVKNQKVSEIFELSSPSNQNKALFLESLNSAIEGKELSYPSASKIYPPLNSIKAAIEGSHKINTYTSNDSANKLNDSQPIRFSLALTVLFSFTVISFRPIRRL